MTTSDMHALAERLARGEDAAFAELYDASADQLHRYLAALLRSREAASDVVQSAFGKLAGLRVWPDDPAAWLFRVVRHAAIDALQQRADCGRGNGCGQSSSRCRGRRGFKIGNDLIGAGLIVNTWCAVY